MLKVIEAEHLDNCKVRLRFNGGKSGVVDLQDALWGPVFEPLKEAEAFKKFHVSDVFHTITWENGADFAPEFLYKKMHEQAPALGRP